MAHRKSNKQSFRQGGGSAFCRRLRCIRHPVLKLLLLPTLLLIVALMRHWDLSCLWQELFGIPCPGCGMTRAVLAFLQGDLRAAFDWHFMFFSLPILYVYLLFDGRVFSRRWLNRLVLAVILLGFLVHWILLLCQR